MEPEGSLPDSQKPATWPFSETDQSSPFPHPISWRFILILSSHLGLGLSRGSFAQVSPPKPCMSLSSRPYVLRTPPISFFLIWSPLGYRNQLVNVVHGNNRRLFCDPYKILTFFLNWFVALRCTNVYMNFSLTLRLLMSYIYGVHILDVSRSHTTTHHSR